MRFLTRVLTLACLATACWGQSSNPQVIVVTSSNVVPLSSSQTYVSRPDSSAPAGDNTGSSVAAGMVGSQVTGSSIATSQLSGVAQCQERYEMMLPATDSKGQLIDKSNLNSNPLMQAIEPCLDDYQNGDCGDLCHAALAPLVANFSCCMPYVYDRTLTLLPVIYSTVLPNYDDLRGFVSDTCDLDIADGDDTCGDSDNTSAVTETPINPYNSTISCLARFDAMDSQPIDMPGRLSNPIIDSLVNTCWQDYQNDECNDACKLSLRPYISNYTCCFEQLYERSLPALPLNVSSVLPQYGDLSDWLASTCEFSWNSDDDCNEDAPGNWDNTAIGSSTPAVAVASGAGSQVGSNVLQDGDQGDNNGNESQGNNIDNGNENN